ncbi:MAG: AAA family ATPase [Saprospiraceae bacterium]
MNLTFTIKNFKCFEEQSVPLGQLTVLAGANSVGKSSVVQALLLSRVVVEKFQSFHSTNLEGVAGQEIPLNGPFVLNLGNASEVLNRNALGDEIVFLLSNKEGIASRAVFQKPTREEAYSLLCSSIDFGEVKVKERNPFISVEPHLSLRHSDFYYLNAERIGPRIRHEVGDLPYPHAGWQGEYAIQVIGENKTMEIPEARCFDTAQARNLVHQSRLWLENIAPGTRLDDANLIRGIKTAEVNFADSKPTNVGFGLSYVLPIIVNGLVAASGSMFIVENPEAHLHPLGQSQIGKFLAKVAASGVQVVIETHSEHVINGIRIATMKGVLQPDDVAINFFQRNEETGSVEIQQIGLTASGDLTKFPTGFFDQTQQDLVELIKLKQAQPR